MVISTGLARNKLTFNQSSQESEKPHISTITVTGQASIYAYPDQAELVISIITEAKLADEAVKENSARTSDAVDALIKLGISKSDIETIRYSLVPIYYYSSKVTLITGYKFIYEL